MKVKKILILMLLICIISACDQSSTPFSSTKGPNPTATLTFTLTSTSQSTSTLTPTLRHTPIPTVTNYANIVINNAQIIYYDISGLTEAELRHSINSLRPKNLFDGNKPSD